MKKLSSIIFLIGFQVASPGPITQAKVLQVARSLCSKAFSTAEIEDIHSIENPLNDPLQNLTSESALITKLRNGEDNIYLNSGRLSPHHHSIYKVIKIISANETKSLFILKVRALKSNGQLSRAEQVVVYQEREGVTPAEKAIIATEEIPSFSQAALAHPDTAILFERNKHKIKTVGSRDIILSAPTLEETNLQKAGFGPVWTKGMDKLNEWVEVRRRLKNLKANPWSTHIEYFADQIKHHLAFAEQALKSQWQEEVLAVLKKEAKKAILKKKVTYEWWIHFNFRLTTLLSNTESSSAKLWKNPHLGLINKIGPLVEHNESWIKFQLYMMTWLFPAVITLDKSIIKDVISLFPLHIVMPTTEGEMGIITFNRAQTEGIYPLGLITDNKTEHGINMDPFAFISHDMDHAYFSIFSQAVRRHSDGQRLRHKNILALIEGLPTVKRKRAELIYFLVTHEAAGGYLDDILISNQPRAEITKQLTKQLTNALQRRLFSLKMVGLGQEWMELKSYIEQSQYIQQHIIEDFMQEVYDPSLM